MAEADVLADQLMLMMEGVYACAQSLHDDGPARHAQALPYSDRPDSVGEQT